MRIIKYVSGITKRQLIATLFYYGVELIDYDPICGTEYTVQESYDNEIFSGTTFKFEHKH